MLYMQSLYIQSIISVRSLDNAETNRLLEIYDGRGVEENSNTNSGVTSPWWLEPGMEPKMLLQYIQKSTNMYMTVCIVLLLLDSWY